MKKIIIEHRAKSIDIRKNLVCLVPDCIDENTSSITLLHGLSDNENAFLDYSNIFYIAERYNLIVILPAVERSFYTNTFNNHKYYDYVSEEIYEVVENTLNISFDNMSNYIGGFSMGGYGAIKVALRTKKYDGVFSFAGALDIPSLGDKILANAELSLMSIEEWQTIFGKELKDEDDVLKMPIDIPNVHLVVGDQDFLLEDSLKFKEINGGKCELEIQENENHDWFFVNRNLEQTIKKLLKNGNN